VYGSFRPIELFRAVRDGVLHDVRARVTASPAVMYTITMSTAVNFREKMKGKNTVHSCGSVDMVDQRAMYSCGGD
jgi:hypothetical protein